jgi:hypothetical protein
MQGSLRYALRASVEMTVWGRGFGQMTVWGRGFGQMTGRGARVRSDDG